MSLAQGNNTPTRPRIEPGSPDPESDALTIRPVRQKPKSFVNENNIVIFRCENTHFHLTKPTLRDTRGIFTYSSTILTSLHNYLHTLLLVKCDTARISNSILFGPPPLQRKAEGHSFRHSVLPSVLQSS